MFAGPSGFALARFAGSHEVIETELPNLSLEIKNTVLKRPATAQKSKGKSSLATESDSDDVYDTVRKKPASKGSAAAPSLGASPLDSESSPALLAKPEKTDSGAAPSVGSAPAEPANSSASLEKLGNYKFQSAVYGLCKAEFYSAKSYIRNYSDSNKKWSLVIGSQHPKHRQIIRSLARSVEAGNSKAELLAEREQLQAEDVS